MINITIERNSDISLVKQITREIKEMILQGTIQPEEKLPSQRELATFLNISRNIVMDCYEQLIAEGYAYSKNGSGTYICKNVILDQLRTIQPYISPKKQPESYIRYSFRTGIPDLSLIPIKKWASIYHRVTIDLPSTKFDYQNSFGDYSLRVQIALYLNRARGTYANPEQIIITNGAAQSFSLLSRLVSKQEYALVEDPLSYGILHTLDYQHVYMKPIKVDEYGMVTSKLPCDPPRLIFTTPSHQFPTGVILPINRRIELIQYARKHNCYIVEDDYDSEFRFDGSPIQSLQYLDPEHVIYVGTFSKTLMPSLRIGYMVLPAKLCNIMKEAKYLSDLHSPILEQIALAEFIKEGCFELHIRKMRKLYLKKRNCLVQSLKKSFGNSVIISGAETGMHLIATFPNITFNSQLMNEIAAQGIQINTVSKHCFSQTKKEAYSHSLIFGYGNTPLNEISPGIQALALVIQ